MLLETEYINLQTVVVIEFNLWAEEPVEQLPQPVPGQMRVEGAFLC